MRLRTAARLLIAGVLALSVSTASAQDRLPWQQGEPYNPRGGGDIYRPPGPAPGYTPPPSSYGSGPVYGGSDAYRPPQQAYNTRPGGYESGDTYRAPPPGDFRAPPPPSDPYRAPPPGAFSEPYRPGPPPGADAYRPPPSAEPYDRSYGPGPGPRTAEQSWDEPSNDTFSRNEIMSAGHSFFGSVSQGLASVVEYAFKQAGRPNGYILGEDAGGAFVAGLRYGEGVLHTKDAGRHKVYWQGPSLGYDFGAEGSKVMVLVYNLRDPAEIYQRFGGVQGSAYLVGGVGIQFQKAGDVTLAPIRSGIGLRLGANVGYLKYTRRPTWNPF
jgi:hypothetical protein